MQVSLGEAVSRKSPYMSCPWWLWTCWAVPDSWLGCHCFSPFCVSYCRPYCLISSLPCLCYSQMRRFPGPSQRLEGGSYERSHLGLCWWGHQIGGCGCWLLHKNGRLVCKIWASVETSYWQHLKLGWKNVDGNLIAEAFLVSADEQEQLSRVGCTDALDTKENGGCSCKELNLHSESIVIQRYVNGLFEWCLDLV